VFPAFSEFLGAFRAVFPILSVLLGSFAAGFTCRVACGGELLSPPPSPRGLFGPGWGSAASSRPLLHAQQMNHRVPPTDGGLRAQPERDQRRVDLVDAGVDLPELRLDSPFLHRRHFVREGRQPFQQLLVEVVQVAEPMLQLDAF